MNTYIDKLGRRRCRLCTSRDGTHKRAYMTNREAENAVKRAAGSDTRLRAYREDRCGCWHLSDPPLPEPSQRLPIPPVAMSPTSVPPVSATAAPPPVPQPSARGPDPDDSSPKRWMRWPIYAMLVLLMAIVVVPSITRLIAEIVPSLRPLATDGVPIIGILIVESLLGILIAGVIWVRVSSHP